VVTEFRQKLDRHFAPITLEVERLTESEMRNSVKEWLWKYRKPYLAESDDEEAIDDSDRERMKEESNLAWSCLSSVFAAVFEGEDVDDKYLLHDEEGAFENISTELLEQLENITWPEGEIYGSLWTASTNTTSECIKLTKKFMEDSIWPFTKIIRYVSPILSF
jgi:hypothetical protein